ncbi:hypothetical protein [Gramella sp. AN32]|uniref:Uncharacterized protein n=1 Tax=Christiangramia antarctica TaxID=2058158 RepID=A0ABW5X9Y6_9FLAO|nr:hypothetical protein [Gramella sp. AN32]
MNAILILLLMLMQSILGKSLDYTEISDKENFNVISITECFEMEPVKTNFK